jgi:hypothetical protein
MTKSSNPSRFSSLYLVDEKCYSDDTFISSSNNDDIMGEQAAVSMSSKGLNEQSGKLNNEDQDQFNASMAFNELFNPSAVPQTDKRRCGFWMKTLKRENSPVRSILKRTNSLSQPRSDFQRSKHLSFALSPTFISDTQPHPKIPSDSVTNESGVSLDGEELFDIEESMASLRLTDITQESPSRRNSLTQFKAKSSLGFDERFVGLHESDLGSIGNFSWSSV